MVFAYRPKLGSTLVQAVLFGLVALFFANIAGGGGLKLFWLLAALFLALAFTSASAAVSAVRGGGEIRLDQDGVHVPLSPAEFEQVFIPYADIADLEHRKRHGNHMLDIEYPGGKITVESDGMEKRRVFGEFMAALVDAVKATREGAAAGIQPAPETGMHQVETEGTPGGQSAGHYAANDPHVEVFDYGFEGKKALLIAAAMAGFTAVSLWLLLTHQGGIRVNGIPFSPFFAKLIFLASSGFNGVMTVRFLRAFLAPKGSQVPVALGPDGISAPKAPNKPGPVLLDYSGVRKIRKQGKTQLLIKHANGTLALKRAAFADKSAYERLIRSLETRVEMARRGTV